MAKKSAIEWTEMTWNPVTGCDRVSAGCKNCYAATMAKRLEAMGSPRYRNGFEVTLHDDLISLPKQWKKPRTVFVNSMSDLFHKKVPLSFIQQVFDTMAACPHHTFQVLTKRPERLLEICNELPWPENVWMGVSVENQKYAYRSAMLSQVPALVRFLSVEPLIGPIHELPLQGIHWVIVGGESGPNARPMKEEWAISIQQRCTDKQIPFFFKQWGGVQKHRHGRELLGRTFDEMPDNRKPISSFSVSAAD
ncbi:phage Gp37/Gp68 family protein [soil metagenome]|jgi:protein gp37